MSVDFRARRSLADPDKMRNLNIRRESIAVYFGLLILTLAAYWPVTRFDFINFDDPVYVYKNPHIQTGLTLENIRWAFTSTDCSN